MDTQSAYPHDHNVRHQPGEGEDDQHHEKNSVLKKVKAKAKKIKDTIKKHGPGHNHDHGHEYPEGHIPDDHDLDEEDDDEEELVQDPEVHGAPMYDSAAVENVVAVTGQPEDMSRLASRDSGNYETKHNDPPNRTGLGDLGSTGLAPQNTPLPPSSQVKDTDPTKTFLHGEEEPKVNWQRAQGLEEDLAALKDSSNSFIPTNYETEVADPTGEGVEATGVTPNFHSLDKMKINDDQDSGREGNLPFPTGTHDQFSPEPTPPLSSETTHQEHPHSVDKPLNQASYTEKITSATSAIADKAVSAKNMVASKLGYGDKDEKLSPVYEQVAGTGSAVVSKLQGPGTGTATEVKTTDLQQDQDKGVSMKSYIAEKLKPGEEDKALSEVITETFKKPTDDLEIENETRPRGKVTESGEVAKRLGTCDEMKEKESSGFMNSPTKTVVDTIRGTVGSWFGKGEGQQETQQAHSPSSGNTDLSSSSGERIVQESGN